MVHYPQLSTGVVAQYPLTKRIARRTIVNRLPGGRQVKMPDVDYGSTLLELRYAGLTEAERSALEDFFRTCEGRLNRFTLLDPTANLLRWSEDVTQSVWQLGGFLQVVGGAEDPTGGTQGLRLTNTAQTDQMLAQTLEAPGWFHYCFSLWIRASAPCTVSMKLANADGEVSVERQATVTWQHLECSGSITGSEEEITASLSIPAGTLAYVYGLQLEAQTSSSDYKKTSNNSGVWNGCRFASDELKFTANGIDDHSALVQLYASEGASQ